MASIFISWAGPTGGAIAAELARFFTDELGLKAFHSKDIDAGANWAIRIIEELQDCKGAIILITEESANSVWQAYEVGALVQRGFETVNPDDAPELPACPLIYGAARIPPFLPKTKQYKPFDEDGFGNVLKTLVQTLDITEKRAENSLKSKWKELSRQVDSCYNEALEARDRASVSQPVDSTLSAHPLWFPCFDTSSSPVYLRVGDGTDQQIRSANVACEVLFNLTVDEGCAIPMDDFHTSIRPYVLNWDEVVNHFQSVYGKEKPPEKDRFPIRIKHDRYGDVLVGMSSLRLPESSGLGESAYIVSFNVTYIEGAKEYHENWNHRVSSRLGNWLQAPHHHPLDIFTYTAGSNKELKECKAFILDAFSSRPTYHGIGSVEKAKDWIRNDQSTNSIYLAARNRRGALVSVWRLNRQIDLADFELDPEILPNFVRAGGQFVDVATYTARGTNLEEDRFSPNQIFRAIFVQCYRELEKRGVTGVYAQSVPIDTEIAFMKKCGFRIAGPDFTFDRDGIAGTWTPMFLDIHEISRRFRIRSFREGWAEKYKVELDTGWWEEVVWRALR